MKLNLRIVYTFIIITLFSLLLLTSCGNSKISEKGLIDYLPYDLLAYDINGEEFISDVDSLTINERETTDNEDWIQCSVVLTDDYFVRSEEIELYLENYDGEGWQLVSWNRYSPGFAYATKAPSEEMLSSILNGYGYQNIETTSEELIDDMTFSGTYNVNDSYDFVSFNGPITLWGNLVYVAEDSEVAKVNWEIEVDNSGVETNWSNVTGTWKGKFKKKFSAYQGHESGSFELTINELKENGWCDGSGHYWFTGADGETLDNEFIEASYSIDGNCPADAQLLIYPVFSKYRYGGTLAITTSGVQMSLDGAFYGELTLNGNSVKTSDPNGEPIELSAEDMERGSVYTTIELTKDHKHALGSTYAEMCEWYNRESDVYGLMDTEGCYSTHFSRTTSNDYYELRKADPNNENAEMSAEDYCYGMHGWFGRVFAEEHAGLATVADVINYFQATNIRKLDVTDEIEAPNNLGTRYLICMDITLETASGTKKYLMELPGDNIDAYVRTETWVRIVESN